MEALRDLTTLRVGGKPEGYFHIRSIDDLLRARETLLSKRRPYAVLGGGSNVLAHDSLEGFILRVGIVGIEYADTGDSVLAHVGAGVLWDSFVEDAVLNNFWGVENLSGIPGLVGATPIQNVG